MIEDQGEGEEDDLRPAVDAERHRQGGGEGDGAAHPAPADREALAEGFAGVAAPIAKTKARRAAIEAAAIAAAGQQQLADAGGARFQRVDDVGQLQAEEDEEGDLEPEDEDAPEGDGVEADVGVERVRRAVAGVDAGDDGGEDAGDV